MFRVGPHIYPEDDVWRQVMSRDGNYYGLGRYQELWTEYSENEIGPNSLDARIRRSEKRVADLKHCNSVQARNQRKHASARLLLKEKKMEQETNSQVLQRLMQRGGYILVCGGEMAHLPDRYKSHPQVLVWDDNDQSFANKRIPVNTRGIVYNRWISHSNAKRLRTVAQQLKIPVFPLLHKREVMEILDSVTGVDPTPPTSDEAEIDSIDMPVIEEETTKPYLTKEDIMRNPKPREMQNVVLPEVYNPEETVSQNRDRIYPLMRSKYGIQITKPALYQAALIYSKKKGVFKPAPNYGNRTSSVSTKAMKHVNNVHAKAVDDFGEAKKLLQDARAAIDLFLNFLPKLEKRENELKAKQEKIRALLGD